jgi:hypothetical protein
MTGDESKVGERGDPGSGELVNDGAQAEARDVLVTRIVDGRAMPEDWQALRTLAGQEPTVWADLAETQAQHERLTVAVESAIDAAYGIDLPEADDQPTHAGVGRRMALVQAWGGWAAAAAIVLVWVTGVRVNEPSPVQTGGFSGPPVVRNAGPGTAAEALDRYVSLGRDEGTVISALPDEVVLETRALGDGTAEVLYLRQILERRIVDRFYSVPSDEFGRPAALVEDTDAPVSARPF